MLLKKGRIRPRKLIESNMLSQCPDYCVRVWNSPCSQTEKTNEQSLPIAISHFRFFFLNLPNYVLVKKGRIRPRNKRKITLYRYPLTVVSLLADDTLTHGAS